MPFAFFVQAGLSVAFNHFLFDLIYNPSDTLFMKKAKGQGSRAINGYQMLVYQAEKSWELWNE